MIYFTEKKLHPTIKKPLKTLDFVLQCAILYIVNKGGYDE